MIAVDSNLLVYAHRQDSAFHTAAKDLMIRLAEGKTPWAIPWPCLHEFHCIVTHPRVYSPPTDPVRSIEQIGAWMASPALHLLAENEMYWPELRDLIDKSKVQGPLVHDARIAALCLAHGVRELWSADRDFSRFPRLRLRNPLIGG